MQGHRKVRKLNQPFHSEHSFAVEFSEFETSTLAQRISMRSNNRSQRSPTSIRWPDHSIENLIAST
jgi:hypothetical protein